ncbi:MAG: hypothetical protein ACOC95_06740 [Planctomycetota bacterium]
MRQRLEALRSEIDCDRDLLGAFEPLTNAPGLGSILGTGFSLLGWYRPLGGGGLSVKMSCITLLYIPVIPLGVYLVDDSEEASVTAFLVMTISKNYGFYGKLSVRQYAQRRGTKGFCLFLLTVLSDSLLHALVPAAMIGVAYLMSLFF